MNCFLSRSFRAEDRAVVDWFRDFLQAFPQMKLVEAIGDTQIPFCQVQQKIAACHLLCAIVTSRDGAVPSWIMTEMTTGYHLGKTIFAFVEDGISDLGSVREMVAFLPFTRDSLGSTAPDFVRYVFNARKRVLDSLDVTRGELLQKIESLRDEIHLLEAARDRTDEI